MKTAKLFVIISLVGLLVACSNHPQPVIDDEPVWAEFTLIKMDTEIQQRIITSPIIKAISKDEEDNTILHYSADTLALVNVRGDMVDCEFIDFLYKDFQLLKHPLYVQLEGGYVIVDWKWKLFHPIVADWIVVNDVDSTKSYIVAYSPNPNYNNGFCTNQQLFILNTKWEEMDSLSQVWDISKGILLEKPEIRRVKLSTLDNYRSENSDRTIQAAGIDWANMHINYKDKDALERYVFTCDSLQNLYISVINEMIKNNEHLKWSQL